MKNIVFIVYELVNSGPENVLFDICSNLDRNDFNPIIITLRSDNSANSTETKFKKLNIEIRHFSFTKFQLELRPGWVAKKIEEDLTDVGDYIVHAHGHHPTLIVAHMQSTTIATIHGISKEDYYLKKGRILGSYMAWRLNHCLNKINHNIAISSYMMQYYQQYTSNLTLIHNGVYVSYNGLEKNHIKERLNIDRSTYVIIVIGSISIRKNTSIILRELSKSKCENFICLIVGNGPELDVCKTIANNDSRFRFEGFKSNVSDYLNIADICISASLSEGLPLSILESLNVGVPVLMSNIPPHVEIEKMMSLESVKTFSLQKNNLLECFDEMKEKRYNHEEIRNKAQKLFSAQAMSEKYQKIYNQCLNNSQ